MKRRRLRQIVRQNLKNIGTLPTIIKELVEVLNNPWSSSKDLAKVISVDPILSSRLLRLVNSAYYGFHREIVDIQQAISLVGFNTIRSFAFCMTIFDNFFEVHPRQAFNKEQFWIHCLGTGMVAKHLSKRLGQENIGGYFMAGLLHDIGKIFLYQFMPREFYRIMALSQSYKISFYDAERLLININHTEIGQLVLQEWNLPKSLAGAVLNHHTPPFDEKEEIFSDIVLIADNVCKERGIGFGGDKILSPLYQIMKTKYNLSDKYFERVANMAIEEVGLFSDVILGRSQSSATQ